MQYLSVMLANVLTSSVLLISMAPRAGIPSPHLTKKKDTRFNDITKKTDLSKKKKLRH